MISLSIESLARMSQQDADALRAIADIYSPKQRNDSIPVGRLRELIGNGNTGALSTLAELNGAVTATTTVKSATVMLYQWVGSDTPPKFEPGDAYYDWRTGAIDKVPVGWTITPTEGAPAQTLYIAQIALTEPSDTVASPINRGAASVVKAALKVSNLISMGSVGTLSATGTITGGTGAWSVDAPGVHLDQQAGTGTINGALGAAFLASAQSTAARTGATAKAHELHPHDNPATGAPTADDIADQVFSGGAALPPTEAQLRDAYLADRQPDPAQVFSGGAALPDGVRIVKDLNFREVSIVSDEPDGKSVFAIGATATLEQPAPNVQSGTPIPPPLPIVTGQTLPPPSGAATNDSLPPPPPPAPVPSDASVGAVTTSPAPSSAEVDSTGLPWDGRIHAGTKSKVASGAWMKRRGVEASEVSRIEAQLRAAMAIPAPPPLVPVANPIDFGALVPQPATSEPAPTFPTLMTFITERVMANRLTQEQVQAAVQTVGLESINLVMAREDLIPAIMAELCKVAP